MASTIRELDLPLPVGGMNTAASPSQIGRNESPYLRNVTLDVPGEMNARRGYKRLARVDNRITSGHRVLNSYVSPDGTALAVVTGSENDTYAYWTGSQFNADSLNRKVELYSIASGGALTYVTSLTMDVAARYCWTPSRTVAMEGNVFGAQDPFATSEGNIFRWSGQAADENRSVTATVNVGSTSVTLSATIATSMAGKLFRNTASAPYYTYRIRGHVAGTSAMTLYKPYGLGDSTAVNLAAGGAKINDWLPSGASLPTGAACLGVFRDRLFAGRGRLPASTNSGDFAGNLLQWSLPTEPERFVSANYTYVDVDPKTDYIMALAPVQEGMLVLTRYSTFYFTGYDEDSFSLRRISDEIGCIHSTSVVPYRDGVLFASERGVYFSNGSPPKDITAPGPGRGIRPTYLPLVRRDAGARDKYQYRQVSAVMLGENYVMSIQDRRTSVTEEDAFVYSTLTGAWARWGTTTRQPWSFVEAQDKNVVAASHFHVVNVTQCFERESAATSAADQADEHYDSGGSNTTTTVASTIQFGDLRFGPDTTRLRGLTIEHNCHYFNATSSPRVAWAVTMDVEPDIETGPTAVGNVDARYIGNVSTPAYEKYFTTRFRDTLPSEASVVRVTLTKTAAAHSAKLFRVVMLVDNQPTQLGRVNNSTL